jgi:site-specific recombinase XerD
MVKALRQLFNWAIAADHVNSNPANDVPYLKGSADGFHRWTIEEVKQYKARHKSGTKARLALELLLLTGVRRSDVIRLGRQMVTKDGMLKFRETKGQNTKPKDRERSCRNCKLSLMPASGRASSPGISLSC